MLRPLVVGLAIGFASLAGMANAESVSFDGVFNQNIIGGGTGFLGNVSAANGLPLSFGDAFGLSLLVDGTGNVLPGMINLGNGNNLWVNGGTSSWVDAGALDNVQFTLDVTTSAGGATNGTLVAAFTGDFIANGSNFSVANLDEFANLSTSRLSDVGSVTYIDGSSPVLNIYGGLVQTAVPEPSALTALLALSTVGLLRRRR